MKTPRTWTSALGFVALHLLLTLSAACVGTSDDDADASKNAVSQNGKADAGKEDAGVKNQNPEGGAGADADAGAAAEGGSTTTTSGTGTLKVGGTTCTIEDTGLDRGLDGHGWTLQIHAKCPTGLILEISAVDDAPYPQVGQTTFLDQPSLMLFLERADGTLEADTYSSADADGASTITSGPTKANAKAAVRGSGTVVIADSGAAQSVSFDIAF